MSSMQERRKPRSDQLRGFLSERRRCAATCPMAYPEYTISGAPRQDPATIASITRRDPRFGSRPCSGMVWGLSTCHRLRGRIGRRRTREGDWAKRRTAPAFRRAHESPPALEPTGFKGVGGLWASRRTHQTSQDQGLLLRSAQSVATPDQREHEWPRAAVPAERRRSEPVFTPRSGKNRPQPQHKTARLSRLSNPRGSVLQ